MRLLVGVLLAPLAFAQYYIASTIAGNGQLPPLSSGAVATNARLVIVRHVAADANGNIYCSDPYYNQVLQVTPAGTLNVYAGAGRAGFAGDNGPATAALLDNPGALAFDSAGNLYISDDSNGRIRRVTPSGTISTFAVASGGGLALDSSGNLYISTNQTVRRITPAGVASTFAGTGASGFSGDGGAATSARLSNPAGLQFDSAGNLYIADTFNHRIRRVTPAGLISTVAGDGNPRFAGDNATAINASLAFPAAIAIDPNDNLYISDGTNARVRLVSRQTGIISTVAGGGASTADGPASAATLAGIAGLALDSRGGLAMAVNAYRQVRRLTASSIATIAGVSLSSVSGDNRPAIESPLLGPFGVAVEPNGNVLVTDAVDHRVRRINPAGVITTAAGNGLFGSAGNNGPANAAQTGAPRGIAVDAGGNIFLSTGSGFTIRRINTANVITTYSGGAAGFGGDNGPASGGLFQDPLGLATDSSGNLFVADRSNNRIRRIAAANQILTTVAGQSEPGFAGDNGPALEARLNLPNNVAVDKANNVYIADNLNHRVRKVSPAGIITTVAGNGSTGTTGDGGPATEAAVGSPYGVAVDAAGNLYIATANRIRKVDAVSQNISTIGGGAEAGFSGDGGLGTNARFDFPNGIAVDPEGAIYIADARNFRVRKLTPARIVAEGVTNGATFRPGPVAPGQIISIFGFDLGPAEPAGLQLDAAGRVATTLGGTRVTFDGVAAPLLLVSANQINAIVPYGVSGSTRLQVTYRDRPTNAVTLPVAPSSPGIFAVTNQDGSVNSAANPAPAGSALVIYGTGEGQTSPAGVDGSVATSVFPKPNLPVSVEVGGQTAQVLYAGAAPGFVAGVLQVNVLVPEGLSGAVPLLLKVGEASNPRGLNVFVK